MPQFEVQIEDVAISSHRPRKKTLSKKDLALINREARKQGLFPANVSEVISGNIGYDDDDIEDGEIKFFVSVVLKMELDDWQEAFQYEVPNELLERAGDILAPSLDRERNWEVLHADAVEEAAA